MNKLIDGRARARVGILISSLAFLIGAHHSGLTFKVPQNTWPAFQFSSTHEAVFNHPWLRKEWEANVGGKVNGGLSIVGTTLFVESFDDRIYAIDAMSGASKWSTRVNGTPMNTPIVVSGMVFVGTGTGRVLKGGPSQKRFLAGRKSGDTFYGISASTGHIVWQYHTRGENMPTAVLAYDGNRPEIVFANGNDRVYALNPSTGRVLWSKAIPGADFMTSLAIYHNVVFGTSGLDWSAFYNSWLDDNYEGMNRIEHSWSISPNGTFNWMAKLSNATDSPAAGDGAVAFEKISESFASPLKGLHPSIDYMLSSQFDTIQVADSKTGKLLWHFNSAPGGQTRIGSKIEVAAGLIVGNRLFQAMPLGQQYGAFNIRTGKRYWLIHTRAPVKMGAVLQGGVLYFGDTDGHFYLVRASDGAVLRIVRFPGIFTCAPPLIVGDTLFLTNGTRLFAIPVDQLANGEYSP